MHTQTLDCLSAIALWKRETSFFQKVLEQNAARNTTIEFKKNVDHFQNLIIYYNGELIDQLRKKLHDHESKLAHMLKEESEADTEYFKEHDGLMAELESFGRVFHTFKNAFFDFIEHGTSAY